LQIPGVPIMYITKHKYSIERLPEATIGGGRLPLTYCCKLLYELEIAVLIFWLTYSFFLAGFEVWILQFVNNSWCYFSPLFSCWKFSETVVWCVWCSSEILMMEGNDHSTIGQFWGWSSPLILGFVGCGGGCFKEDTIFSEIWNIQMPLFAVLWELVPYILLCSLRLQRDSCKCLRKEKISIILRFNFLLFLLVIIS
jgi:hypothetical protein